MKKIELLDSTLRDGAQGEGISFSVNDRLEIVRVLDDLGIPIIEAGNPTSNPREVHIDIDLHAGNAEATVWTDDLTHEYVHINADYES